MRVCLCLGTLVWLLAQSGPEPRWRDLNGQARAAIQAKDDVRLAPILEELQQYLPGNATLAYNRAAAAARMGRVDTALERISSLVRAGLVYDYRADKDFALLLSLPAFRSLEERTRANTAPVHYAKLWATIPLPDLLPEDLAWDPRNRRLLVASVLKKAIYTSDGKLFAQADLPLLALAADPRRKSLWATQGCVPVSAGCSLADEARSYLVRYDLDTGEMRDRIDSPQMGLLGDMSVGRNGDVFVSEGKQGGVFQFILEKKEWRRLDAPGEFPSPQSPTPSPDGKTLYVADYIRGIAAIDLESRAVRWLPAPPGVILSGIDGLYCNRTEFLAMQNGTKPPRLVRMPLDLSSQTVIEANWPGLGEPTHGTIAGEQFVFLTNTGWDAFDAKGKRKANFPAVESAIYQLPLGR